MAAALRPDDSSRSGLDELRAEALPLVLWALLGGSWLAVAALFPTSRDLTLIWPPLLGVLVWGTFRLLRRGVVAAAALLVAGLALLVTGAVWAYPGSLLVFAYLPLVLIAGMLLGRRAGTAVALLASAVALAARAADPPALAAEAALTAIALVWATAALAWLYSRSLYIAVEWAWRSYEQALEKVQALQERQGELNRALKSLNDAYYRVEQVNAELARARAAAQEARQLKAEFAATISHELRTPLNLIIGFSEMMATAPQTYAGETLPPAYQCDVDAIYRNARHLSSLIDDILDLSQIDARRMGLLRGWVDLAQVLDEAVAAVRALFDGRGLALAVELADDLPRVYVDATRIKQVLINLLNNAARFTERGGVRVGASRRGGEIVVAVADTGLGIAAEDIPKVFDEFRQVDGSIRRRHGGSGLGLAICREFVELHGGNIWVESEPGAGSIFFFSLPLSDVVVSVPLRSAWETWVAPGVQVREPERTLVVVASDPDPARHFQRYLDGWRVLAAPDAEQARALCGEQAVEALLFAEEGPPPTWDGGTAVVSCPLSGRRDLEAEFGVAGYLVKPILGQQVEALLDRLGRVRDVLVVDDDPEMVRLLARMVRAVRPRARVRGAYGGAEALAAVERRRPDLVFLDLLMPGLDGYETLARLRADARFRDLAVVIVSAFGNEDETVRAAWLSFSRAGGLTMAEVVRCLGGGLSALAPAPPGRATPAALPA